MSSPSPFRSSIRKSAVVGLSVLALVSTTSDAAWRKPLAKNVIVMISDGWGFNQLEAASYYQYGRKQGQVYSRFPVNLAMSTYMAYADESHPCRGHGYDPLLAWSDFAYVTACTTDSAAAATAVSTGVKTYEGAIGVDLEGLPVRHALEVAEEHGKATGVVTSVQFSHATPAAFVAHNPSRDNYAEIAREMVEDSAVDVIMGAGHPWYDQDGQRRSVPDTFRYVGGETTWNDLVGGTAGGDADGDGVDDPWVLIQTRAEFQALMAGPTPRRVLGVPQVDQTLQVERSGDASADPYVVPAIESVPTLEEMTRAALNILARDPEGLFLMVEAGAVDWAGHSNLSGRMIEEHIDFDDSVRAVVEWVEATSSWRETVLIVTGDHETGYLTGPGSDPTWEPIVNQGTGLLPGMEWHGGGHTNSLMVLSARGRAAGFLRGYADQKDPVRGRYVDNTDVARVVFRAMGSAPPGPVPRQGRRRGRVAPATTRRSQ